MDEIEGLTYDQVLETVDRPRLTSQLRYVLQSSPFYRDKYGLAGPPEDDWSRPEVFLGLPWTTKEEWMREQRTHPPFGRLAATPEGSLRRVHVTSGSTGRPAYIVLTERDLDATVEAGRRGFACAGLRPDDVVIHCLNYCLWAGGVTDHLSLEATGATVIPFGVGNTAKLVQTILDLKPTAISCTPSYLSRLEVVLGREFGLEPPALGLRKAFLGGEGGLQSPPFRARIETSWNLRAIDANYGMADLLSLFGAECEARRGLHFHGQGLILLELLDPATERTFEPAEGRMGEMVLTHLRREAQPLVRFRTRDLIRVVGTGRCDCGRSSLRFQVVGRTDDMIVVRGVNVFPSAVGAYLAQRPDLFSGEFEFVLDAPPPVERPRLRVELAAAAAGADRAAVESEVVLQCRGRFNFTPVVDLLAFGEFPRTEGKTRRVREARREE